MAVKSKYSVLFAAIPSKIMVWLQHPIILEGDRVLLTPLNNTHFDPLIAIGKQKEIWQYLPIDGWDTPTLRAELKSALLRRASGEHYPFVIIDKLNKQVIGSTRLYNMFPEHRKLEIGWTWYSPAYWATGYNTECKLLLLTYCFEILKTVRVQLQTSEQNMRSRAAIQKIGASFEGILRKERIRPDGSIRNTAVFSIIDDEWPGVKTMLQEKLSK